MVGNDRLGDMRIGLIGRRDCFRDSLAQCCCVRYNSYSDTDGRHSRDGSITGREDSQYEQHNE